MKYSLLSILILLTWCSPSGSIEQPDFQAFEARSGFEIFFDSWASQSTQSLWTSGSTVINGSYFWVTNSWVYYPAGLWIEWGKQLSDIDYDDPNLDIVVVESEGRWQFLNRDGFRKSLPLSPYARGFQAGPLVINEWIPAWGFSGSWHADERHERTMMGITHGGQVYFFIFHNKITLREAGEKIMQNPKFKHTDIDIVNIDGGPSTSFYDGTHGFRENEKLPILLKMN